MFRLSSFRRARAVSTIGMAVIAVGLTANAGRSRASADDSPPNMHAAEVSGEVQIAREGPDVDNPGQDSQTGNTTNIRVNQDRSNFPHDETSIAVNPRNPRNLVAGANDYRLGYGASGFYASQDGGHTWYDGIAPIPGCCIITGGVPLVWPICAVSTNRNQRLPQRTASPCLNRWLCTRCSWKYTPFADDKSSRT